MLKEDSNQNPQTERKAPWVLNLRVSYTVEQASKLNKALQYVVRKIAFKPLEEFTFIKGQENIRLYDLNQNELVIHLQISETGAYNKYIIFHTNDCLRDYHKYIVLGVEFISRPEYNQAGLQVNFIDDEDNYYSLLEERTYADS